ncbi:MAG: hypothetical protein RL490_2494 [Pseudomonadota bacterium]|jgi:hypothetical protein
MAATDLLPLQGGGDSRAARRVGVGPSGVTPTRAAPSGASLASPLKGEEG